MQTKDKNILLEASDLVFGDRPRDYGTPYENFTLIAKYWGAHLDREISIEDVGILMSLLKLARLKATSTEDSWKDLGGYALATMVAREQDDDRIFNQDPPSPEILEYARELAAPTIIYDEGWQQSKDFPEFRVRVLPVPEQIYIAGPMKDIPGFNYEAFDRAEAWLRKKYPTAVIHNPAQMDRKKGYTSMELEIMRDNDPEKFKKLRYDMLKDDLRIILDCQHLFLLPGWENSGGALTERSAAMGCGIHVDYIPFSVGFPQKRPAAQKEREPDFIESWVNAGQ